MGLDDKTAWVMEAKSRKQSDNWLTKTEHGQLLQSYEWFQVHYPNVVGVRVVVHPNVYATDSVTVGQSMALTMPKVSELVGSVRTLWKSCRRYRWKSRH